MKKMGKFKISHRMDLFIVKYFFLCRSLKDTDDFIMDVRDEIYELIRRKRKME